MISTKMLVGFGMGLVVVLVGGVWGGDNAREMMEVGGGLITLLGGVLIGRRSPAPKK